jgi:hypothetical protein
MRSGTRIQTLESAGDRTGLFEENVAPPERTLATGTVPGAKPSWGVSSRVCEPSFRNPAASEAAAWAAGGTAAKGPRKAPVLHAIAP